MMIEYIKAKFLHGGKQIQVKSRKRQKHYEEFEDELAESYCYMLVEGIGSDLMF